MDGGGWLQRRDLGGAGHGGQPRPFAGHEPQVQPQRLRQEQDVGKENRCVESVTADRLQRDLGRQIRRVAQRQKVAGLGAGGAVFRQVAAGLAHHPDRRNGQTLALQRAQDGFFGHNSPLVPFMACASPLSRPRGGAKPGVMTQMPDPQNPIRIGTRGSALALAQAHETRDRLMAAHGLEADAFEIVVIKTTGDRVLDRPLKEIGGKGLFTREIEDALLAREIDIAVHSMKDMPTLQPDGLVIDCYLPREDVRDAFVSSQFAAIAELPQGAVVGSSSLRRRAQLAARRPDLKLVEFRGNVQTRLKKLEDGVAVATFLAMAGLSRLGMEHVARSAVGPEEMLPAVAQGCIGVERRAADERIAALLAAISDRDSALRVTAERAFLARLDGSCQTPIAGLAELDGDRLRLRGEILRPDGSEVIAGERVGPASDGAAMGTDLAEELRGQAPADFFDWS